ncbi:MAG: helix-turn-helix transcriptional regulator [Lachnospiraceae bacterium]|nr:helix-turn-helix transcriptional regulator [Lachnospiraceae bacterium]
MDKRIKEIRESAGLTQVEFGKKIGLARNTIANYETGNRIPSNIVINSICREFGISEEWLRTGNGEMYKIAEDQTSLIVSDLLKEDNPFYDIILEITKTYQQLDSKSKKVLQDFSKELLKNMKEGKE